MKKEADIELAKARPALEEAEVAVASLSKDDVTELKKVNNPIPIVETTLKCVLIYLGQTK